MANFNNNRGGNNRFNDRENRPKYVENRSSRPTFSKRSWGDNRPNDGSVVLHKATCAECGKTCEVPFRPVSGRPVYCKECFDKKGGNAGGERFSTRESNFRTPVLAMPPFENTKGNDVVIKQLETVNTKLERLIQAVEALSKKSSKKKIVKNKK